MTLWRRFRRRPWNGFGAARGGCIGYFLCVRACARVCVCNCGLDITPAYLFGTEQRAPEHTVYVGYFGACFGVCVVAYSDDFVDSQVVDLEMQGSFQINF